MPYKKRGKVHEVKKHKDEEEEEIDYTQLARMELLKLQRKYRLMQGARQSYAEESGTTISRQHRIMTLLHAEKEDLDTDYKNASCRYFKKVDEMSRNHMVGLMQKYDEYQAKIKDCISTIEEMEDQVDKITRRVIQQNLKIQTLFGSSMNVPQADKRLRNLENRLYQMTKRFDTLVSENVRLRSDINTILMERGRFHKRTIYIKQCVSKMKRRMNDIVDIATQTYEARDEYATKMKILRERDEKESRQHVQELKEWQRVLHDDEKQHSFMARKYQDRNVLEKDSERESRHLREQEWVLDDLLMRYKKSFKAILVLGISADVESLCHNYMEIDQTNFSNFKYISDINNEIEVIRDTIDVLKDEILSTEESSRELNILHERELAEKESMLEECENQLILLEQSISQRTEEMDENVGECELLFNILHCDNQPIISLLGNSYGMNSYNLAMCISVIEKTLVELIKEKNILTIRKSVEVEGKGLPSKGIAIYSNSSDKPKPGGGPFKPKVLIAGRLDAVDEDNEDEKLLTSGRLTYEELRDSILDSLRMSLDGGGLESSLSTARESVAFPPNPSSMFLIHDRDHPGAAKDEKQGSIPEATKHGSIPETAKHGSIPETTQQGKPGNIPESAKPANIPEAEKPANISGVAKPENIPELTKPENIPGGSKPGEDGGAGSSEEQGTSAKPENESQQSDEN